MPSVQIGDIDAYYEIHGDGPPLVLVGGLGVDVAASASFTSRLAHDFRVLTFDNRRAGNTDDPGAPYSIPMMAEDTLGLMDELGIGRAHLVGASLGGQIAMEIAAAFPERVDRLVLVSTAATGTSRLRGTPPARLVGIAKHLHLLPGAAHQQPDFARRRQLAASAAYDGSERLGVVNAPTLILHARNDRNVAPAAALATRIGIRDAQIEFFRGGHMFFVSSQRDAVAARIEEFLTDDA